MEKPTAVRPASTGTEPAELARGRAELALALRKYPLAERIARDCIAQAPDRAVGYWLLARALRGLGKRTEGLQAAQEALRHDPGEPAFAQLVGLLLLELGDVAGATQGANGLIEQRPDWSPAWDLQARACLAGGELAPAEHAARTLVSLEPESADAFYLLGRVLWMLGRDQEARDCYTTGLRLDPRHAGCLAGTVTGLLRARQFTEARAVARDLVRVAPEDPNTARLYAQTVGYAHPLFQLWATWAFTLASLPRWQRFAIAALFVVPYLGVTTFLVSVLALLVVAVWRRLRPVAPGWTRVALGLGAVGLAMALLPVVAPIMIVLYPVALVYLWLARPVFWLAMKRGWFL